jgi:eukaryotic-like serine/threonine-protein kinase
MDSDRWREVSRIYHAARTAEDPARFLDGACAGDDQLRAEVESLLAHDAESGAVLAAPGRVAGEMLAGMATPPMRERIGSYRILSFIGAGGMGVVHRARDLKLDRDVAIKVLPHDVADDPERKSRLLREARAVAALNHPNICTIYEVGETDGGVYLAMEMIDGRSLTARLANGALGADDIVRYGCELADALAHAHDRGVIHRDLKSANVMVTSEGRIKVLDFGLARRIATADLTEVTTRPQPSLTQPGVIVGTLAYMAPEQLRAQPADARTDIWALGVVLYEMAAGRCPFDGKTGFELSSAIFHAPPPPLPLSVPPALRSVTSRCLEKDPARRYQSAKEVRAALETSALGTSTRSTWRVAAVALLVLLTAGLAWLNRNSVRQAASGSSAPIRSLAVLPLDNLSGNADEDYFVAGMHHALITDLARIGLQKVIAKSSADVFKGTTKPLRDVGRELGVEGLVTGAVVRAGDRIQISAQLVNAETGAVVWANRYERMAGDVLALQNEIVAAIAREVRATLTPEQTARLTTARPVNPAAHDAYLKGRSLFAALSNSFTPALLDAAVAQFERAIQIDPTYAPPYAALSLMYLTASQTSFLPPGSTFPKARTAALKAVELDDSLPEAHAALGGVYLWYDWNWQAAEREIRRALQLNPDSTDALVSWETYELLVAGRAEDAERTSQRIVLLDPVNQFSRVQRVWLAFFSRRYDDSIANARSLLEVAPNNFMAQFFLALNHSVKRMGAEVDAECATMLKMLGGAYAMQVIGTCVWAYAAVGHTELARGLLRTLERPPAGIWQDPVIMSNAYAGVGDARRSFEWMQKGLEQRSPNMIYMKATPLWDSVRADSRFQAVLRQMNFPG